MLYNLAWSAVPLLVVVPLALLVEAISAHTRYPLRDKLPGALYLLLLPSAVLLLSAPLQVAWRQIGVPQLIDLHALHPALQGLALFLLVDFLRYWEHRFEHRFFWRFHAVHHAPTEVHATSVLAHPLIALPEFLVILIPLSLVGVGPLPLAIALFIAFQNLIIHSPLRVHAGPLRAVYVDSRFHRLHHSIEPRHRDKNFGLVFSIWDQMFGTSVMPKPDQWPATGVLGMPPPQNPFAYLWWPLRRKPVGRPVGGAVI